MLGGIAAWQSAKAQLPAVVQADAAQLAAREQDQGEVLSARDVLNRSQVLVGNDISVLRDPVKAAKSRYLERVFDSAWPSQCISADI